MNDMTKPVPQVVSPTDTIARLSAPRIFASEKAEDHASLRAALFTDLAPRTAYESNLAENLVQYEWEMARLRRFRDTAILAEFRDLALKALLTGDPKGFLREGTATEDDHFLIRDLVSPDPRIYQEAEEDYLKRCPWDPADLLGLAYARAGGVTKMEERIADLERRRRILRTDYTALKATSAYRGVDDAEVLEGGA